MNKLYFFSFVNLETWSRRDETIEDGESFRKFSGDSIWSDRSSEWRCFLRFLIGENAIT